MVGNNSGTHPPFFSRHLVPQNLRNINFLLIFSILDGGPRKVNDLLTSPSNQFRDYFIWNRIEKLMPQLWNFSPQTLKTFKKNWPTCFQTLTFCRNLGFQKPWICPWIFHGGVHPRSEHKKGAKKLKNWKTEHHQPNGSAKQLSFFVFCSTWRWMSMDIHGYPWMSMDIHGYPWTSMDIHGCPWTFIVKLSKKQKNLVVWQTRLAGDVRFFSFSVFSHPFCAHSSGGRLHGKSMDKSRVFGNPDFGKKSRFENKLVSFF